MVTKLFGTLINPDSPLLYLSPGDATSGRAAVLGEWLSKVVVKSVGIRGRHSWVISWWLYHSWLVILGELRQHPSLRNVNNARAYFLGGGCGE